MAEVVTDLSFPQPARRLVSCGTCESSGTPAPCEVGAHHTERNSYTRASKDDIAPVDQAFLRGIQRRAIEYFVENQLPSGLILDRQRNHDRPSFDGLCSIAATGMGFIALALATDSPHRTLSRRSAIDRIGRGLAAAYDLPHHHGMLPHFVQASTGQIYGCDRFSTIDSSWLFAGALWAASFLNDTKLKDLAAGLYDRVDWRYWSKPVGAGDQIRHGWGQNGRYLDACWDRLNGETAFMYVLAAGACEGRAIGGQSWRALQAFPHTVSGLRFNSGDLGLFVFQYGLDLLDLDRVYGPGYEPAWSRLMPDAKTATVANYRKCKELSDRFGTYRKFWGISAGDGPPEDPYGRDTYRCYAPLGPVDGTAHITATAASIALDPDIVLANLYAARREKLGGRYGFSSVNWDRSWRAKDMVGIDAGAAILAIDNFLEDSRVRYHFHGIAPVEQGLARMHWELAPGQSRGPSPLVRLAS